MTDPIARTAARIAGAEPVESSWTEHSAQIHVSMSATFEGAVDVGELRKLVKSQFKASIEEAMRSVARELRVTSVQVDVMPMVTDFASVDSADIDDEADWASFEDGSDEPDIDEELEIPGEPSDDEPDDEDA